MTQAGNIIPSYLKRPNYMYFSGAGLNGCDWPAANFICEGLSSIQHNFEQVGQAGGQAANNLGNFSTDAARSSGDAFKWLAQNSSLVYVGLAVAGLFMIMMMFRR